MATTQLHLHIPLALASSPPSQFHQSSLQLQTRFCNHRRTRFLLRNRPRTHSLATRRFQAVLRTCKNCKIQFDPELNHPCACRFHTSHFGGETKRKFESVYKGGTMSTPDSGQVFQYWHCCGSEDPFDLGCTAAPHSSYDD